MKAFVLKACSIKARPPKALLLKALSSKARS